MEIIALEIEIRSYKSRNVFSFNQTMLYAVISGLGAAYKEALIWLAENHMTIWVVGDNSEPLASAFTHHRHHYKKMSIVKGSEADKLFDNIILGKMWNDCSSLIKFNSLKRACELSIDTDCMANVLQPMVSRGLVQLNTSLEYGLQEVLSDEVINHDKYKKKEPETSLISPDLVYRICLN